MSIPRMDRSREPRGRWRRAPVWPGDVSRALDTAHPARVDALQDALDGALHAFGRALEVRGLAPLGHAARVVVWADCLGRDAGLDGAALRGLRWGALLHDVGLLAVGSATAGAEGASGSDHPEEHPLFGLELVRPIPGLPPETLDAVRSHHERWDGAGFPEGLSGEEIPLAARIVTLADAIARHEAAAGEGSPRARTLAHGEVRDGLGRRFDPHLGTRALLMLEGPYPPSA